MTDNMMVLRRILAVIVWIGCAAAMGPLSCATISQETIVVEEAVLEEPVILGGWCEWPYRLTQDCGAVRGPLHPISVSELDLFIGGSEDGTVILMIRGLADRRGPRSKVTAATNEGYRALKEILASAGFVARRVQSLQWGSYVYGYFLVFDRDVYSVLRAPADSDGD